MHYYSTFSSEFYHYVCTNPALYVYVQYLQLTVKKFNTLHQEASLSLEIYQ
jgi:hypothetical protein